MLAFFAIALLAVSFASAVLVVNPSSTLVNVEKGDSKQLTFNVFNSNITDNESNIVLSIVPSSSFTNFATLSSSNINLLQNGSNSSQITITFSPSLSVVKGNYSFYLKVNGTPKATINAQVSESILIEICGSDYTTENISFGTVEDEEEWDEDWKPLDYITVTAKDIEDLVNDDDDEKYDLTLVFYQNGKKVTDIAENDDDLEVDNLKVDDGDEEDTEFNFRVSGEADDGKYDVYLKVKGSTGCFVEKVASVDIAKEEYYSIVQDVTGPVSSGCGETVELTVDVANIGDEDDWVKVFLYNRDLGINMVKEVEDLDSGDETSVTFSFIVPQNAVERNYKFTLSTEFEYDEDDEEYDSESDSDDDYTYTLGLSGNCIDPIKPTLSAKLNSSAIVGENLVVAVTFKNNGNTSVSAILAPEEYESWAELVSIEPATITVGRAETKTVYMTFKPSQDGQQTFNLNAIYSGKSIDQPVTVTIESNTSWMASLKEQFGSVGAYLIVGIVVLVALIILVLVIKLIVGLVRKH